MSSPDLDMGDGNALGDILFLCIGAFVLVFMLMDFDAIDSQEKALPDVQLSKVLGMPTGTSKLASLAVTVIQSDDGVRVLIDEREVGFPDVESELSKLNGIARVTLRCDERVPVGVQNQIIAACQRSGIERVALVIQATKGELE